MKILTSTLANQTFNERFLNNNQKFTSKKGHVEIALIDFRFAWFCS